MYEESIAVVTVYSFNLNSNFLQCRSRRNLQRSRYAFWSTALGQPFTFFLPPVHSISSRPWSALSSLNRLALLIFRSFRSRYVGDINLALPRSLSEQKFPSKSSINLQVRSCSLSLSKDLKLITFSALQYAVNLLSQTLTQYVRTYLKKNEPPYTSYSPLLQVLIFGTYSCRLLGDGVVAVAMCYMLYTRSSGFRRQ